MSKLCANFKHWEYGDIERYVTVTTVPWDVQNVPSPVPLSKH
jgi:hypothetical protein